MKIMFFLTLIFTTSLASADLKILADGADAYQTYADNFQSMTGQKVVLIDSKFEDSVEKLKYGVKSQDENVAFDLIIAKDLVELAELKSANLTKAFQDKTAFNNVKNEMMDVDSTWVGLTYRARTLVYASNLDVSSINNYSDLQSSDWAGGLCLRTSSANYNLALTSYLIAEYGEQETLDMLLGWMDNLAEPVMPKDSAVIEAIKVGICDVGIINHYYLARDYSVAAAEGRTLNVSIKFLNQDTGGVHTNGYGIAQLVMSKNEKVAQDFAKYMVSEDVQTSLSAAQLTYPVLKDLAPTTRIKDWGAFKTSSIPWSELGENLTTAGQLILDADYN